MHNGKRKTGPKMHRTCRRDALSTRKQREVESEGEGIRRRQNKRER
jgi:hypothetical protein